MNKIIVFGIAFLLMFMFPIILHNTHASVIDPFAACDPNDQVIVNGQLITAHSGSSETFSISGNFVQINVNQPSVVVAGYNGYNGPGAHFAYYVPAGSLTLSSVYDGVDMYTLVVVKAGDYMFGNTFTLYVDSNQVYTYNFGYLYLTSAYGSTMDFNVGVQVQNGTSGTLGYTVSGTELVGYYETNVQDPYTASPSFALPATVSAFSTNDSVAVTGVSLGMAFSGYNTTISAQLDYATPNATLNVYSNVEPFTLKISTSLFSSAIQQYVVSPPYPNKISLIQGVTYSISGIFNNSGINEVVSYSFVAKSVNNYWFNFSVQSPSNNTVKNITIGHGIHYNINYLKNGDYLGGIWSITINGTQYTIAQQIIYIKEYYNTSPYSLSIIFGDYAYAGVLYPPTINSYSIPSTSNNTIYVVYYNISNTQNLTVFGLNEFDVIGGIVVFVALMLPAVAISLGKRKGGK